MSLRRTTFASSLPSSCRCSNNTNNNSVLFGVSVLKSSFSACSTTTTSNTPITEESSSSATGGGDNTATPGFSSLRDSLHQGAESASVYSTPSTRQRGVGFEDPQLADSRYTRLYMENVVDVDPIGGAHRSDYYRDPSVGYAPTHAPRNYATSGSVDVYHPLSSLHYETQFQTRSDADHASQFSNTSASTTRDALLQSRGHGLEYNKSKLSQDSSASASGAAAAFQQQQQGGGNPFVAEGENIYNSVYREAEDASAQEFFDSAASPRLPRNVVGNRQQQQQQSSTTPPTSATSQQQQFSWLDASSISEQYEKQTLDHNREAELELFRRLHGERDRERFEESRAEIYALRNPGYDVDRIEMRDRSPNKQTNWAGRTNLLPLVPPGSAAEAQNELRKNNISSEHALWQEQASSNTTASAPLIGEGLTQHLVETSDAKKRASRREATDEWRTVTGRGRVNPLVADAGPDQRPQKLAKNDERLLHAAYFQQNAYKKSDADERAGSEYTKRNITKGVAHLLDSEFDRRRRADILAEGKQDPIERSQMHLGVPVREQIDDRVRGRINYRTHRPIEYFQPSPKPSDMLLLESRSDVEGFPLWIGRGFNIRLQPFEWDLFIRYRAHASQRKALALQHGLEPRPNESVQERTARREALDDICEKTPFDPSFIQLDHGVDIVPIKELRNWFGAYWLPSPSLTKLMLGKAIDFGVHLVEEKRAGLDDLHDDREHVISTRYVNKLLTIDTFNARLGRQNIKEQFLGRAPEITDVIIPHRVSESTLRHFTPDQRAAYDEYIRLETEKHVKKYEKILTGRRFLKNSNAFARLMKTYSVEVTTISHAVTGQEIIAATSSVMHELKKSSSSSSSNNSNKNNNQISLEGIQYNVDLDSTRQETFVSVKTEHGDVIEMLQTEWNSIPEEASPAGEDGSRDVNTHLNDGSNMPRPYPYNRGNYIETQDVIWETRVANSEEGWTTAIHPDNLQLGMPVKAKRIFSSNSSTSGSTSASASFNGEQRLGDFERATVFSYQGEPFYNPNPRQVSVVFHDSVEPVQVPLANTLIWQAVWSGAERASPLRTYRLALGMKRFVNMQDPKGKGSTALASPHFLDRYLTSKQRAEMSAKWRTSKSIFDIDKWTVHDINRPHNHRLISGTGVRNYFRSGFLHRYTPWEFILTQEADQPMIAEQVRKQDSAGPSMYFAPNRFWRYKRRSHGFIKNYASEVRDLFQYVDAITPWEKAKQIRTHWEVREHHPIPAFFRPSLALHRNNAQLLPAHLWESDKKTGKVKVLKDSLKDYKPVHVHPSWVKM